MEVKSIGRDVLERQLLSILSSCLSSFCVILQPMVERDLSNKENSEEDQSVEYIEQSVRQASKVHLISRVEEDSIAEEMGIEAGDILLSINGKEIADIFDYRMLEREEELLVLIRKKSADGASCKEPEEWELEIEKDSEEELGLEFSSSMMDNYRSCCNGCVFCFIDQMPKGMRKTLYFKDDDARLSFLQGNYVTLTNMTDSEVDRILKYHLSPINISFHTTDPQLRVKMLKNPAAGTALEKAKRLCGEDTGIELHGQIVLCKGLNDGENLDRSMRDLFYDYAPNLTSVSIVPVGLSRFRKNLYPLESFSRDDARKVLEQIHAFQAKALDERGDRFIYASDEWYFLAEYNIPDAEFYGDYSQLENGVGMVRLLIEEVREAYRRLMDSDADFLKKYEAEVSLATGMLAAPAIGMLLKEAEDICKGLKTYLYPIRNDFFGEKITVSGLLTGRDILAQLKDRELGERLLLPANILRSGEDVLLDDVRLPEISEKLNVPIATTGHSGYDFVTTLFELPKGYLGGDQEDDAGANPYELQTLDG